MPVASGQAPADVCAPNQPNPNYFDLVSGAARAMATCGDDLYEREIPQPC